MPGHRKIAHIAEIPKERSESQLSAVDWRKNRAARREMIFKLVTQGVTPVTISGLMRVSKKTITNDINAIKREQSALVRNFDPHEATGGHLLNLEYVFQQAMKSFHATSSARTRERRGWMETALKARQQLINLQMDTGLIPRAGEDGLDKVFQVKGPDGRKYDIRQAKPADLRMLAADLAQKVASNPKLARALKSLPAPREASEEDSDPTPLPESA